MPSVKSTLTRFMTLGAVDLDRRAADRSKRMAAEARWAAFGASVDLVLPAFLTGDTWADPHPATGTRWLVLADLALAADQERAVPVVFDLAPGIRRHADEVLPRGTTLRVVGTHWVIGHFHGVDAILFDLAVEDGPMAGRTVCLAVGARLGWRVGMPRSTLAAAMIVARGDVASDPTVAHEHYDLVVQTLRDAGTPTESVAGLPCDPIAVASDLSAIGCRQAG